jgi:hypothetical protein
LQQEPFVYEPFPKPAPMKATIAVPTTKARPIPARLTAVRSTPVR